MSIFKRESYVEKITLMNSINECFADVVSNSPFTIDIIKTPDGEDKISNVEINKVCEGSLNTFNVGLLKPNNFEGVQYVFEKVDEFSVDANNEAITPEAREANQKANWGKMIDDLSNLTPKEFEEKYFVGLLYLEYPEKSTTYANKSSLSQKEFWEELDTKPQVIKDRITTFLKEEVRSASQLDFFLKQEFNFPYMAMLCDEDKVQEFNDVLVDKLKQVKMKYPEDYTTSVAWYTYGSNRATRVKMNEQNLYSVIEFTGAGFRDNLFNVLSKSKLKSAPKIKEIIKNTGRKVKREPKKIDDYIDILPNHREYHNFVYSSLFQGQLHKVTSDTLDFFREMLLNETQQKFTIQYNTSVYGSQDKLIINFLVSKDLYDDEDKLDKNLSMFLYDMTQLPIEGYAYNLKNFKETMPYAKQLYDGLMEKMNENKQMKKPKM